MVEPAEVPRREPHEWEALLRYERFVETHKVRQFDCGDLPGERALNDFLNTAEVSQYAELGLGQTTLVYFSGHLVAYFTTSLADLSIDYVKHVRSFSRYPDVRVVNLPSVKIGRLAVQRAWKKKGIGETIVHHVGQHAIETMGDGVRLLILEAYPSSITFYQKVGFELTNGAIRAERQRRNETRTMFFDLNAVRGRATDRT